MGPVRRSSAARPRRTGRGGGPGDRAAARVAVREPDPPRRGPQWAGLGRLHRRRPTRTRLSPGTRTRCPRDPAPGCPRPRGRPALHSQLRTRARRQRHGTAGVHPGPGCLSGAGSAVFSSRCVQGQRADERGGRLAVSAGGHAKAAGLPSRGGGHGQPRRRVLMPSPQVLTSRSVSTGSPAPTGTPSLKAVEPTHTDAEWPSRHGRRIALDSALQMQGTPLYLPPVRPGSFARGIQVSAVANFTMVVVVGQELLGATATAAEGVTAAASVQNDWAIIVPRLL